MVSILEKKFFHFYFSIYPSNSYISFRKLGIFESLKLIIWLWILLASTIMSQSMEVDSQQSMVGSQSADMEDEHIALKQKAVDATEVSGHLVEANKIGHSESKQETEACEYLQLHHESSKDVEETVAASLEQTSEKVESSFQEPSAAENVVCQGLKADNEFQTQELDGTGVNSLDRKCDSSHESNQLVNSSPLKKPLFDESIVCNQQQDINSAINMINLPEVCNKDVDINNEDGLSQQEKDVKVVNDEKSNSESINKATECQFGNDAEKIIVLTADTDTDVEIFDGEDAKMSTDQNLELLESEDEDDDELMGFHFNEDEVLVDKNDETFEFNRFSTRMKNQRRYEKLGEKITEYVYHLLETRCKLKRVFIPLDAESGEDRSFIFVSPNAFETVDKLIVFIHGSGVVRAGQWARSLIINNNLKYGSQIPFIEESLKCGYEVMVLNTNLNSFPDGGRIRGSEDPEGHALYVWENLVEQKVKAKHIAIIAHSYGGYVTKELVSRKSDQFFDRVFAVAFTDSVHSISITHDPVKVIEFFRERTRNWVTSSLPLDEPVKGFGLQSANDSPRFSAGHEKHEWTSWSSFAAIFKFLNDSYENLGQQNEQMHPSNL